MSRDNNINPGNKKRKRKQKRKEEVTRSKICMEVRYATKTVEYAEIDMYLHFALVVSTEVPRD